MAEFCYSGFQDYLDLSLQGNSPLVHCSILWNRTGYLVILWVTSNMHSGIPSLLTTALLIFFCKGVDTLLVTTWGRGLWPKWSCLCSWPWWGLLCYRSVPSQRLGNAYPLCRGLWSSWQTGCAVHRTCHMSSLSALHSHLKTTQEREQELHHNSGYHSVVSFQSCCEN